MDSLQALPRDTAHVREILFTLPLPFSLSTTNYQLFWPLIDNVYSILVSRGCTRPNNYRYYYVIYRYKRARDASPVPSQSSSQRASTTKRSIKACQFCIIRIRGSRGVSSHERHLECRHDHSLDESDANKRNSLLRAIVQCDIAKGYAPAAVIGVFRGTVQADILMQLETAGGLYLSRQDAINSGLAWRLANPNALFATLTDKDDASFRARDSILIGRLVPVLSPIGLSMCVIAGFMHVELMQSCCHSNRTHLNR
jgi:hypothetical protein